MSDIRKKNCFTVIRFQTYFPGSELEICIKYTLSLVLRSRKENDVMRCLNTWHHYILSYRRFSHFRCSIKTSRRKTQGRINHCQ